VYRSAGVSFILSYPLPYKKYVRLEHDVAGSSIIPLSHGHYKHGTMTTGSVKGKKEFERRSASGETTVTPLFEIIHPQLKVSKRLVAIKFGMSQSVL
jgi:hypothetical protein